MIYQFGDVVVVPFPFTDLPVSRVRPVVAISSEDFSSLHGQSVLAMITTAGKSSWPTDVAIQDLAAAGLRLPSVVRWKVFTLVNDQIVTRIGRLSAADRDRVISASRSVFGT